MKFQNPVTEIMMERISCRTYTKDPILPRDRQRLEEICREASNSTFRFVFLERTPLPEDEKLAAYGTIRNARHFIAGIVKKNADLVEFGAVLETIVLLAEDTGLSTVWLGGTFKRKGFIEKIKPSDDEIIPIVIATGYGADKPSIPDRLMRSFAGAARRKAWNELFFDAESGMHLTETAAGAYAFPLEMLRIAPSTVNVQPWRIFRDSKGYHFYLRRRPGYREKSGFDIQMIDIGIALSHFVIASRAKGLKGRIANADPGIKTGLEYVRSWHI